MSIRCCCSYRASERRSTRLGRGRWNRGTWQRGTRYLHKSLPENLIKKTKKIQQLVPQFAPTCAMVSVGSDADVQNVVHCLVSLPHSAILSALIRSSYSHNVDSSRTYKSRSLAVARKEVLQLIHFLLQCWPPRSSKVDDFHLFWKGVCHFLLVINSKLALLSLFPRYSQFLFKNTHFFLSP